MTHNQYPVEPEQEFAHQEYVQFSDGEVCLGFRTPGDRLTLGEGSVHKYARHFGTSDMAWITTRSGNHYGIASGLVINQNREAAWDLPEGDLEVTIGEPLQIPGVGVTTAVEDVLLRWKITTPDSKFAEQQIDAPSPFPALAEQARAIHDARSQK